MAAGDQVDVSIKLTADTKGGAEAQQAVDRVEKSAKEANESVADSAKKTGKAVSDSAKDAGNEVSKTAREAGKAVDKAAKDSESTGKRSASGLKSAYEGFGNTVSKVGKVVGNFTKALGLIGFAVSAIQTVIAAYQKLQEWLHKDEIAAAKLREEIEKKSYEESVARVTRNYEQLNQQVAENLRLEQQRNALIDERTRMERDAEDAQLRLDEAKEVAALDQNDPDYGNKAALVRQKYARKKSDLQESRAAADNKTEVDRLYKAAEEMEKKAAELRRQTDWGSDAKRNLINKRAEYAETEAAARGGDGKAKERLDAVKKEYEEAKAAYDKIKAAAEEAEKAARELREQAANKTGANLAAKINNEAAQVEIDTQERQTRRSIENDRKNREEQARQEKERKDKEAADRAKKRQQADLDAATIADAPGVIAAIQGNIADVEGQMDAARAKEAKERRDAWEAKNNLDLFNQNHAGRRLSRSDQQEQRRLAEAVQKETNEAQNASVELQRTLSQLSGVLQGFTQQMKQVQREVDAAQKRTSAAQAESPSGI